ncbi:predicted protein, partial [Nematostella vectensis]
NSVFPLDLFQDFFFKQLKKIRVFDSPGNLPTERVSLIAVSNKFGYSFIGCPTGIYLIVTVLIPVTEFPSVLVPVNHAVRHVGLSSDDLNLSVCYENAAAEIVMRLYDVPTLCQQVAWNGSSKIIVIEHLHYVVALQWNPGISNMFALCLSDGSVSVWEVTSSDINQLAALGPTTRATAICWSPKGKQLVVGHKNGKLTQLTPGLQPKKETDCPDIFGSEPHQVTSVCWISAPVFAVVYTGVE